MSVDIVLSYSLSESTVGGGGERCDVKHEHEPWVAGGEDAEGDMRYA